MVNVNEKTNFVDGKINIILSVVAIKEGIEGLQILDNKSAFVGETKGLVAEKKQEILLEKIQEKTNKQSQENDMIV